MNYKTYEKFKKILESGDFETDEDLQKAMDEINQMMDFDDIESPMSQAYDYMEEAQMATSKKEAIKYAEKALKVCPDFLEAKLFLIHLNDNLEEREKDLIAAIDIEEENLKKLGYFDDDNIGMFWGIFETRPYIKALGDLIFIYISKEEIDKAIEISQKILKLNENDNTGIRFVLMALYAYTDNEKSLKTLFNNDKYECLQSLVPFLILYYNRKDYLKAKVYLDKIKKCNKHFQKYYKGEKINKSETMPGYYSPGDSSEVFMYLENYAFLLDSADGLVDFIKNDGKK